MKDDIKCVKKFGQPCHSVATKQIFIYLFFGQRITVHQCCTTPTFVLFNFFYKAKLAQFLLPYLLSRKENRLGRWLSGEALAPCEHEEPSLNAEALVKLDEVVHIYDPKGPMQDGRQ